MELGANDEPGQSSNGTFVRFSEAIKAKSGAKHHKRALLRILKEDILEVRLVFLKRNPIFEICFKKNFFF